MIRIAILVMITGCVAGTAAPTEPTAAAAPEFAEAAAVLKDADAALAAQDYPRADALYLQTRVALFHRWAAIMQTNHLDPYRVLKQAVIHADSGFGAEAEAILWRTFVGRADALRALEQSAELVGERPLWPTNGDDCPEDIRTRCKALLAELVSLAPGLLSFDAQSNVVETMIPAFKELADEREQAELVATLKRARWFGTGSSLLDRSRHEGKAWWVAAITTDEWSETVNYTGRKVLDHNTGKIVDEKIHLGSSTTEGFQVLGQFVVPARFDPDDSDFVYMLYDARRLKAKGHHVVLDGGTLLRAKRQSGSFRWLFGIDIEQAFGIAPEKGETYWDAL